MQYCTSCGAPLNNNQKFCSKCGTPVVTNSQPPPQTEPAATDTKQPEDKKQKGQYTKEGRKIIDAGPKPEQHQQTSPTPSISKPPKKKKRGCLGCLGKSIIIIFVLLIVGVVIIWNLPDDEGENTTSTEVLKSEKVNTKKSKKSYSKPNLKTKSTLVKTTVNTDTAEVIIKATDTVSIILPIALLDNEEELIVKELKPVQLPNGQKSDIVLDITLGNQHKFDDFIEVLITPPANFNPQNDFIQCLSLSLEDKSWQPVMAFYEPETNKIKMVTDHLTSFAINVITYNGVNLVIDPMYTVATETYKYFKTIASNDAVSILEGYNTERVSKTLNKDYHVLSWNTVMDSYGLAGTGLSFLENGAGMSGLSKINNAAGNIGIGLSVIQIALDAYNGKVQAAQVGVYKTFLNTIVSKGFNTRAMNLALIGVFAIDYSLTTFANEAWAGRKALYQTIWDSYQKRQRKKKVNLRWWKKEIMAGMKKANDPSKFESVVEGIIAEYIKDFWADETEIALIQSEVGPIFSAGGGLNKKMTDELSADFRLQTLQYLQSLLGQLQKKYIYQARRELSLQRAGLAKELNREHLIRCEVILDKNEKPDKYEQLKVEFGVVGKEMLKMWQGLLNKNAKMDFYCTIAGYIGAGAPTSATLFIPNKMGNGKFEKIKASVNLIAAKTTLVEFKKIQSKIVSVGISINFEGTEKVSYSGKTTINEDFAQNLSGGISFENGQIIGNTIIASEKYIDDSGGHISTSIKLTFEDINNPIKILSFSLKNTEDKAGSNAYNSFESVTGTSVPFVSKKDNNTIDFRYEGDIRKYLTDFKYESEHSTGLVGIHEFIKLNPQGSIQILIEYKK